MMISAAERCRSPIHQPQASAPLSFSFADSLLSSEDRRTASGGSKSQGLDRGARRSRSVFSSAGSRRYRMGRFRMFKGASAISGAASPGAVPAGEVGDPCVWDTWLWPWYGRSGIWRGERGADLSASEWWGEARGTRAEFSELE